MADTENREIALELGDERYILRPEFGVIMRIEDVLDTNMFKLGLKIEQLDFRLEELIRTVRVILEANGYKVAEEPLAAALAKKGTTAIVTPLIAFVQAYAFGVRDRPDDEATVMQETAETAVMEPTGEENTGAHA